MNKKRKLRLRKVFPWAFYDGDYNEIKDWVLMTLALILVISIIGTIAFTITTATQRYEASLKCPEDKELVDMGTTYLCLDGDSIPQQVDG